MGDSFLENIQGLTTLKIYQADEEKSNQMDVEAENFRIITMKVLTMQLNSITIMDLVAFGGAALGVIVSVSEFLKGNISFAGTFAIIMLSSEFFIPLRLLGSFFHNAMNGMSASEKIFRILDLDANELEGEELRTGDIVFEDMSFAYDKRDVLSKVNLEIKEGSFVSFVGESGSGKSTIASLLMGNHPGFRGEIKISGVDITILGGFALVQGLGFEVGLSLRTIFILVSVFALSRGILRYIEQLSNHYIAFKLLAIIRNHVFTALRRLAPAKLEGRDKGNLISIITSDIELLEVFYAHTISPIAIAFLTSIFMVFFIGRYSWILSAVAALAYIMVGVTIPLAVSKMGSDVGLDYRNEFGSMNSFVLDSLRGLNEIILSLSNFNKND